MRECDLGRPIHGKCKAVGGWQNMGDESGRLKCADASFRRCYGRLKNATDDNFCQLWWTCRTAPGNRETATIGRPFPWRPNNARRTPVHRMIDAASRQAPGTSCRWPPCTTPGPSMRRYKTLVTRSKHAKGRSTGALGAAARPTRKRPRLRAQLKSPTNPAMSASPGEYQCWLIHRNPYY